MTDELWWEIDGELVLLPRDQWPYEPHRLGTIMSLAPPAHEVDCDCRLCHPECYGDDY